MSKKNMSDFNIIMLSAWHEQGGNAVLRLLDSHPSLFVYPFESQISTPLSSNILSGPNHWVPQRYSYPEFLMETSPLDAYNSFWDEELKTLLRTPFKSKFKDCGLQMIEKERVSEFVSICNNKGNKNSRADFIEAYFRSTFNTWKNFNRTGSETHYVGYSPPILLDADKFFNDFPNGHMIHVVRNPMAGYADTLKRPFPFSLRKYAQIWNVCQIHALTYVKKYPNRFHLVRAEDIMSSPRSELNKIFEKINIPNFEKDPEPCFNRVKMDTIYPWGTLKKFSIESNNATINELNEYQKDQIKTECSYMLNEFKYI